MEYHTDKLTEEVDETDKDEEDESDLNVDIMSESQKLSSLEKLRDSARELSVIEQRVVFSSECQTDEPSVTLNHKGKIVMKCRYCFRPYVQEHAFRKHEESCNRK
jgi:hypothetical protein